MNETIDHDKAIELLPWLVNDSLTGEERILVERHVHNCVPCRAALREQQRLATLVREHPTLRLSADRGFDELIQRIELTDSGSPPSKLATVNRWYARASARPARIALAASLAVAMLGTMLTLTLSRPGGPDFVTLTESSGSDGDGIRLDIVFTDGAGDAERLDLIEDIGAAIVGGPTDIGRYTIRFDEAALSTRDLEDVVTELRNDRRVRLVAPSFIDGEPR